jgi:hypothetical protein
MKLKEFLTESKKIPFIDVITPILRDCKPFIKEAILPQKSKINFLYSGRGGSYVYFDKKKARKDRSPKDTYPDIHYDFDKEFQKQYGYPARSSSIFSTGDYNIASEYGYVYCMFPIGRYKYLWNPNVKDLYMYLNDKYMGYGNVGKDYSENPLIARFRDDMKIAVNIVQGFKDQYEKEYGEDSGNGHWEYNDPKNGIHINVPKGQDSNQYIKSKVPKGVKINFSQYLDWVPKLSFESYKDKNYKKYEQRIKKDAQKVAEEKYYNIITEIVDDYRNDRIVNAIKSGNEIMINCNEYYILNADYEDIFNDWISEYGDKIPKGDIDPKFKRRVL